VGTAVFRASGTYVQNLQTATTGCDSVVVLELQVEPPSSQLLDTTICQGDSIVLGSQVYTTSGSYVDTLRTQDLGCDSIVRLELTVLPSQFQTRREVLCSGETVDIAGTSYDSTGTYLIQLTNAQGCDSIIELEVIVLNPQAVVAPLNDTITCDNLSVELDGTASTPAGAVMYRWERQTGPFSIEVVGSDSLITVDQPGRYFLQPLQELEGKVCGGVRSAPIDVPADTLVPPATIQTAGPLTCDRQQVLLDGSGSASGPAISYRWISMQALPADSNLNSITVDAPGAYTLQVSDSSNGCSASATTVVSIDDEAPDLQPISDTLLTCNATAVSIRADLQTPNPAVQFRWTAQSGMAPTDSLSAEVLINRPDQYMVSAVDSSNGCVQQESFMVALDTVAPTIDLSPADTINCTNTVVSLSANLNPGGSGQEPLIQWSTPAGSGILTDANQASINVDQAGVYSIEATDPVNGCSRIATQEVIDSFTTVVASTGPDERLDCILRQVTLRSDGSTMGASISYQWSSSDGQIIGPDTASTITVARAGAYLLTVRDQSTGCFDTSTVRVTVDTLAPVADAGTNQQLTCADSTLRLDAYASSSGIRFAYEWAGPCLLSDSTTLSPVVNCAGDYRLLVSDLANGCTSSDTVRVEVNTTAPMAKADSTALIDCAMGLARLDASASAGGTISWSLEGTVVGTDTILLVNQPGSYLLTVRNTALGCVDTQRVQVQLDCMPQAMVTEPDTLNCIQSAVQLDGSGSTSGSGIIYQWSGPDASCFDGTADSASVRVNCPGIYQLIVTNSNVNQTDTVQVQVLENRVAPLAEAGLADTLDCDQTTIQLDGTGSSQGDEYFYRWLNAAGDTLAGTQQLTVTQGGLYVLEVRDSSNGCTADDLVNVSRDAELPEIRFGAALFPCDRDTFRFRSVIDPANRNYRFAWSGPGIVGNSDSLDVLIDQPGIYEVEVVDQDSDCRILRSVDIVEQDCQPCLQLALPDTLTCDTPTVSLQAAACEPCTGYCQFTWTTNGGTIVSDPNQAEIEVSAPGVYRVVLTDSLGISSTDSVQVFASAELPILSITSPPPLNCRRDSVLLSVSANTTVQYQWTGPDSTVLSTAANLWVSRPGTYQVQAQDTANGCTALAAVEVEQDSSAPVLQFPEPDSLSCTNTLVRLAVVPTTGSGNYQFTWQSAGGGIRTGDTTRNPLVDRAGVYEVSVVDQANGCSNTGAVRVDAADDLPALPDRDTIVLNCDRRADTIRAPDSDALLQYAWILLDAAGDTLQTDRDTVFVVSQAGTLLVEAIDSSSGCRNQRSIVVRQDTSPPSLLLDPAMTQIDCISDSITLGVRVQQNGTYNYSWRAASGRAVSAPDSSQIKIAIPDQYIVTVRDQANFCTTTDTVTVSSAQEAPSIDAGTDLQLSCSDSVLQLQGIVTGASADFDISWSSTTGIIVAGGNTLTPQITAPGVYLLQVRDRQTGCVAIDSALVTASQDLPAIVISGLDTLTCQNDTIRLSAAGSSSPTGNPLQYRWENTADGRQTDDPALTVSTPGTYRIEVRDSRSGCRSQRSIMVPADLQGPELSLSVPDELTCTTDSVVLQLQPVDPNLTLSYTWSLNGIEQSERSSTLTARLPGNYQVEAVNVENGCSGMASVVVQTDASLPQVDILPPRVLGCEISEVDLTAVLEGDPEDFLISWSTSDGQFRGDTAALSLIAAAAGTYRLRIERISSGCVTERVVEVVARDERIENLEIDLSGPTCPGGTDARIEIQTVNGGIGPYLYSLQDQMLQSASVFTGLSAGAYQLTVEDALGCQYQQTLTIPNAEGIQIELGADTTIQRGDSLILRVQGAPADSNLSWSGGLPNGQIEQVVAPTRTTRYTVRYTSTTGCSVVAEQLVTVVERDLVFAPTVFSPNDDGQNDLFTLYADDRVRRINYLRIFDRWGNQVFFAENITPGNVRGWDGTYRGEPCQQGVYLYVAEVQRSDGSAQRVEGDLTLLR